MKYRHGFVTNSSSSSFIVPAKNLTPLQIYAIYNHIAVARDMLNMGLLEDDGYWYISEHDAWGIRRSDDTLIVSTIMDNFDMGKFLCLCAIPAVYTE